jgi:hypothetical protein
MAAVAFTLSNILKQNLGGGCWIVGGMLSADSGDYSTGGVAPSPTFASLDPIGNREPDIVFFRDADGYRWHYDNVNGLLQLYALNLTGAAEVNAVHTEFLDATAVTAAVGADAGFTAFWFPTWNSASGGE